MPALSRDMPLAYMHAQAARISYTTKTIEYVELKLRVPRIFPAILRIRKKICTQCYTFPT